MGPGRTARYRFLRRILLQTSQTSEQAANPGVPYVKGMRKFHADGVNGRKMAVADARGTPERRRKVNIRPTTGAQGWRHARDSIQKRPLFFLAAEISCV